MTSGGLGGTNGEERRSIVLAFLLFAGVGFAFAIVNAVSVVDDRARLGRPVDPWEPWAWELTSVAAFLLLAPAIMWLSLRLRPPRVRWMTAVMCHALLTVPASVAHVALMVGLREAIYVLAGANYGGAGGPLETLVYEYRKDVITYAAIAFLPHMTARLFGPRLAAAGRDGAQRIEVRDGSRRRLVAPGEIDWAQAAGNYVELHGDFGKILHRQTLAGLEAELRGHGFVRIHRSRIVRGGAVTAIETNTSGDFEITLANGSRVSGSRRFRSNLDFNPCA